MWFFAPAAPPPETAAKAELDKRTGLYFVYD
jgi:hypothetical protein